MFTFAGWWEAGHLSGEFVSLTCNDTLTEYLNRREFSKQSELRRTLLMAFYELRKNHISTFSILAVRLTKLVVPIEPNALFEEVILAPRLGAEDVRDRGKVPSIGVERPVRRSDLYQRTNFEIAVR
jgi:hypothetical protein